VNQMHASRDPGRCAVDHDHKVDIVECVEETGFGAREVRPGIRRAEDKRRNAAAAALDREQEHLPSEVFFG
jgi:hypothetical protein